MRAAVGYSLAEEALSVERFREKYAAKMAQGPDAKAFAVVTAPIGPDLTHVGSRLTLAGGALPNTIADLERWIGNPAAIKPGSLMPPFGALGPEDLRALAAYLKELR